MRSRSRWSRYQPTVLYSRTVARRLFCLRPFLHPGRPAISDCLRPRVVHALLSQEEARTHLACGGLDGESRHGGLPELSLLLPPRLVLLHRLARHAICNEGWVEGEVPVHGLGIEDATNGIERVGLDDTARDGL